MPAKKSSDGKLRFETTILQAKKTATGICVPDEIVEQLGAGKKPPVKVTINNYTYRSSIAVMDGKFMVGVSADVREKAGVAGGDKVRVSLELDTEPREVTVPEDFQKLLSKQKDAKAFFDALSYSGKLRYVLSIEQAETQETRDKRLSKAIEDLKAGKK